MLTLVRNLFLSLLWGLLVINPGHAGGNESAGEPIPDTIYMDGSLLQFFAMDRAVDQAGRIDTNLLRESTAMALRDTLNHPASKSGCVELSGVSSIDSLFPGLGNIESSIANTDHILIGRVLGRRPGGLGPLFGTLILIETEEIFQGSPAHRFYVFFPRGSFQVRGQSYCIENDYYPEVPKPEDRMLVMYVSQNTGSEILGIGPRQLIVLPESGGTPQLGSDALEGTSLKFKTNADVVDWVRHTLGEGQTSLGLNTSLMMVFFAVT